MSTGPDDEIVRVSAATLTLCIHIVGLLTMQQPLLTSELEARTAFIRSATVPERLERALELMERVGAVTVVNSGQERLYSLTDASALHRIRIDRL